MVEAVHHVFQGFHANVPECDSQRDKCLVALARLSDTECVAERVVDREVHRLGTGDVHKSRVDGSVIDFQSGSATGSAMIIPTVASRCHCSV